jgi:cyclase
MSGLALRVIPCLDLDGRRVVKGTSFKNLKDAGDPVELVSRYEEEGADEIALLDISATVEGRKTALGVVRAIRNRIGLPIVVGGGIAGVEDAERLLEAGADRVSVNSAAFRDPDLIGRLASRFGVQCVVVAVDARRMKSEVAQRATVTPPRWELVVEAGRRGTGADAVSWAAEAASRGAGEILLTSVDRDGSGKGYDLDLVSAVVAACPVPVVASGGASELHHFADGARAGARALLAAGAFHRAELGIGELKSYLRNEGMEVRI